MTKTYRVHSGRYYRYFATLDDAKIFCEAVFQRSGIVLSIEKVKT
jgi:hypothetical protein